MIAQCHKQYGVDDYGRKVWVGSVSCLTLKSRVMQQQKKKTRSGRLQGDAFHAPTRVENACQGENQLKIDWVLRYLDTWARTYLVGTYLPRLARSRNRWVHKYIST